MRKTNTGASRGKSSSLTRAARISAIALGIGVLMTSHVARAGDDDDDDKTFEEKIIEGVIRGLGGTNMDNNDIDYRERSPLVVPPKLDLPAPQSAAKQAKTPPNWPKDPDEARRKAMIAARKKENKDPLEQARILNPDELNRGRTSPSQSGPVTPDSVVPGGEPGATAILSPSQMGFDSQKIFGMFKGNTTEITQFKQEPPRESLTQPPAGYQTPSPNFAYGTGPKESLNKDYAPEQGKYGE
jgi:hypothetical protein